MTAEESAQQEVQVVKTLLIGAENTGKTSFLNKYFVQEFNPTYVATVGIDFRVKDLEHNGENIKLQMWDCAGQERYKSITQAYYRGTRGFGLFFDVNREDSFNAVPEYYNECKESNPEAVFIVVGSKSDLLPEETRAVEKAKEFASKNGLEFFLSSSKTGENIDEAVAKLLELIFASEEPEPEPKPKEPEPEPKEPEPKPKEPEPKPQEPVPPPKPKEPEPKPKEPEPTKSKQPTPTHTASEGGIVELLYHWKVPLIVLAASVSIYLINKYYFD